MELTGLHHLTAVTANAAANHRFYTQVLGMRLVKRTVNQDDVRAYHLFYADGRANPGTDLTFFDWPLAPETRGTRSIVRTMLRVSGEATLRYWCERLSGFGVAAGEVAVLDDRATLLFEDPEGQRLALVDDGGRGPADPWDGSPVPLEHQIRGLGPVVASVPALEPTDRVLREVLGLRPERRYDDGSGETQVYAMGEGGPAAELHLRVEPDAPVARPGAGGVHHVAFRIPDAQYEAWAARLASVRLPKSGPVDRFYFRSLYMREPGGILLEIATDGPGFTADEPLETLGQRLSLPPFLEGRRVEIEQGLVPLA